MNLLINVDVPDLAAAIAFYTAAFGLTLTRRFGADGAELDGGPLVCISCKSPKGRWARR
jgi:catechol 2,3-dioxygenase-like lactoylglutathione lyase family enzyme